VRVPKEIEDQEHGQVLPAGSRDRLRTRSPGTPPDGPGSGSALGQPPACRHVHRPGRAYSAQATELTKPQCDLFTALAIDPPKRIQELAATRWPARIPQQPPTALTGPPPGKAAARPRASATTHSRRSDHVFVD
jgi:hypothetical protein